MNKIEKNDLKELFEKKYNIEDDNKIALENIIDDIYNLNINEISPLSELETLVFRKKYGVLDFGTPVSIKEISTIYNINYNKVQRILTSCLAKLYYKINGKEHKEKKDRGKHYTYTKENLENLLIKKYNLNELDKDIVIKIILEIYDLNNKKVEPLSELETFIFRKRYGVLDSGIPITKEIMSQEYKISFMKLQNLLDDAFKKIGFRINHMEKRNKISKMSSYDREKSDIFITDTNFSTYLKNYFLNNNIYTVKELLEYSLYDLEKKLSNKNYLQVVNYVHSLGLKFIEELDIEEKKNIVTNSNTETIYNSSMFFVNHLKNIPTDELEKLNVNSVREITDKLNLFSKKDKISIMQDIIYENIPMKKINNYSLEELYNLDISNLGIDKKLYDILNSAEIKTIKDLISLKISDLSKVTRINNITINELVNKIHDLGLVFRDEMELMELYSRSIYDEIKKNK